MGSRETVTGKPNEYATKEGFPNVRKDAPGAVLRCASLVERLLEVTSEHGLRETGRQACVSHSTLSRTIAGEIWPSVVTIVAVEDAFSVKLWV